MNIFNLSHKGTWCMFNLKKFCQEGHCDGCQIYLDAKKASDFTRAMMTTTELNPIGAVSLRLN